MELTGSELTEAIQSVTYEWLPGQNIVREAILKRFEVGRTRSTFFFTTGHSLVHLFCRQFRPL